MSPRDDYGLVFHKGLGGLVLLEGVRGPRGVLFRNPKGWIQLEVKNLHPLKKCSPLVWDETLNGVLMYGGEIQWGGRQFEQTSVLRISQS